VPGHLSDYTQHHSWMQEKRPE